VFLSQNLLDEFAAVSYFSNKEYLGQQVENLQDKEKWFYTELYALAATKCTLLVPSNQVIRAVPMLLHVVSISINLCRHYIYKL